MPERQKEQELFDDASARPGILTDEQIRAGVSQSELISAATFQLNCLEASSYDIRVGSKGVLGGEGIERDLKAAPMDLPPGGYGGVVSLEKLHLPANICARIGSKRALAYEGIILLTGAVVDPGYEGHLLFGLYNASQKRVLIRAGRKISNIVFERLPQPVERLAPTDPNLLVGSLPDVFVDKMANMEVLPWMQISERVGQIEQITKDILDLKARYDDVLKPIRDLTGNVDRLTSDVTSLAAQTKGIADNVSNLNSLVRENSAQIGQLTTNIAVVDGNVKTVQERTGRIEDSQQIYSDKVTTLQSCFGHFQVLWYVIWTLVAIGVGAALPEIIRRIFSP